MPVRGFAACGTPMAFAEGLLCTSSALAGPFVVPSLRRCVYYIPRSEIVYENACVCVRVLFPRFIASIRGFARKISFRVRWLD